MFLAPVVYLLRLFKLNRTLSRTFCFQLSQFSRTSKKYTTLMWVKLYLRCRLFFQEDTGLRSMLLVYLFHTLWCIVWHVLPSHVQN
jgi:hypothetical protein